MRPTCKHYFYMGDAAWNCDLEDGHGGQHQAYASGHAAVAGDQYEADKVCLSWVGSPKMDDEE